MKTDLVRLSRKLSPSLLSSVGLLLAGANCSQADTVWNTTLGDWFTATNWTAGVPGSSTDALIDSGLASVSGNAADADTALLTVGGTNTGKIAGIGLTGRTLNTKGLIVGRDAGSNGLITAGSNSLLGTSSLTDLVIGDHGTGTITASLGANLYTTAGVSIGKSSGGVGNLTINAGRMDIQNGIGLLDIGDAGTGTINISNAGVVVVFQIPIHLGRNGGSGTLTVSGTNSQFAGDSFTVSSPSTVSASLGGSIILGTLNAGPGQFNFGPNGYIATTTSILSDATHLTFTLAGATPGQFGTLAAQSFSFDGALTVALDSGYSPLEGDSFSLFTLAGSATGQFDTLDLPGLGSNLFWDSSTLYTNGFLRVVPEPATGLSLLLGGLALGVWRRFRPSVH